MKKYKLFFACLLFLCACGTKEKTKTQRDVGLPEKLTPVEGLKEKLNGFAKVKLTADLSGLSENSRKMVPLLIEAAKVMDELFWEQAWGDKSQLMEKATDPDLKAYLEINYGPWDRLDDDKPFIKEFGAKPMGAGFYPDDMEADEYDALKDGLKDSPYSVIVRNSLGDLEVWSYSKAYEAKLKKAASYLREAAALAEDPGLKSYLEARAGALLNDNYFPSDSIWMAMKNNPIDIVIGPIESYEDKLFGKKTSFEAYVLIKDQEWSARLSRYATLLPMLQEGLPADAAYKSEKPGSNSDLNAYDVVYYAGDCNAGGKTIAINLPNDERFQLEFGTRRLQLKNVIQAKFDKIMKPISDVLIHPDQRKHVTFDAFFSDVMFHEVAHGLGIKNTINGKGTVSGALQNMHGWVEEGKADILGLYMIGKLIEQGEMEGDVMDYYVTFLAGIFRSVRFGAASDHGKANMVRFNYFSEKGAFNRAADGTYSVDKEKMQAAIATLSAALLEIQGDGDKAAAEKMLSEKGLVGDMLQKDLDRLSEKGIPVDIVFEQGTEVLGLQ